MRFKLAVALVAMVCFGFTAQAFAAPIGDTFTYQGRLDHGGTAVTVPQDLEFRLFDAAANGSEIGGVNALNGVVVTNGLFTVPLSFGVGAFGNEARYLEIRVRPSGSGVAHTVLTPRQPITPAPVALSVAASGVDTASIKDGAITGAKVEDGAINRAKLSADFTPIMVAKSSFSQRVLSNEPVNFDTLVKNAGFSGFLINFSPTQSGYYMVSVSLSMSQFAFPDSTASVNLYRNGVKVHTFGTLSVPNPLNSETWLDLGAGDQVSIYLETTTGPSIIDLAAGAQLRIVRLD